MNKVILTGNLTRDPELHETAAGKSVLKFDIAVNRGFKDADGKLYHGLLQRVCVGR